MNDSAALTAAPASSPRPSQRFAVAPAVVTRAMGSVWLLTFATHIYGVGTGLVNAAAPQAALHLGFSSQQLGLVGAGVPSGYAAGCILSGWVLSGVRVRRVLLGGMTGAVIALALMFVARTPLTLIVAQTLYGVCSGAVWPFFSSWLLDFIHAGVPRVRVLRHYNMAWTSGTALGMLSGGQLCARNFISQSFVAAVVLVAVSATLVLIARDAQHLVEDDPDDDAPPVRAPHAVTRAMLLAAASFNLMAIGTKLLINVTYVELNALQHSGAERMGYFMAGTILIQLLAFAAGRWYEPYLGCRRVYIAGALALTGVNVAFATVQATWILLPAAGLAGLVLATAFQGSILAFTARSRTPRAGTTFSEAIIGMAGLTPIAAGFLVDKLRGQGAASDTALRAPFVAWAGLLAIVLIAQMVLVSTSKGCRRLAA